MYILNRDTGKPVFGVEERPVAKGDVPGEWYSPTQPFPLKPPPLARNSYKADDIVTADDTSPEHAQACQEVLAKNGGSFVQRRTLHRVALSRGRHASENHDSIPWRHRRRQLGRRGHRSDRWIRFCPRPTTCRSWAGSKRRGPVPVATAAAPKARPRFTIARASWVPVPTTASAPREGRDTAKCSATGPARNRRGARLTAVNAQHRRHRVANRSGITEGLPADKQNTGNGGSAGPDRHRGRPGVHRRHFRPSLPRLRFEDRQGAVGHQARKATPTQIP